MIRHVVSWKLNGQTPEVRSAQAQEVKAQLESLPPLIPEILALQVGINDLFPEDNHDVVLIADYDDVAALNAYVAHPDHQRAVSVIRTLVASRAAVDFTV